MAFKFNISSMPTCAYSRPNPNNSSACSQRSQFVVTKCELNEEAKLATNKDSKLKIGSPIIVTEAPQMLKTAASVPCLRINAGLVKPGDVGRVVSRKPKDVWAVRLSIEFCFGECTMTAVCGDCYCKERCLQMHLGRHGYCNDPVPGSIGKCCCARQAPAQAQAHAQALSKENNVLGGN
ncbi:unnamed protein product [Fraxinus pennsylvanica]|uniref:Uncharacterized protein n=1 Tax=Fraxinus pennsylvanica TaxID=56036 RepID=A0AAD2EDZ7_9LAMI|nr:unnamed protein product [Fraxinus pennsylvanica]